MSKIRSLISASLVAAILAASAPAVSAQAASEVDYASCPELTDSVRRLYGAYFLRSPDSAGYRYWLGVYSGPGGGLATISDVFASSTEFSLTYGELSDDEFVALAYRNVFDREPDAAGLAHWSGVLGSGTSRGQVMLSLSESKEYVEATGTLPPLAGYMTWYDESVQFSCGAGSGSMSWATLPETAYADVLFTNLGDETTTVDWVINSSGGATDSNPSTLDIDRSLIVYNTAVFEFDPVSFGFVVDPEDDNVFWAAVIYDHPASATRSPYTDPGGGEAFLKVGAD